MKTEQMNKEIWELVSVMCPDCGGYGIIVDYTQSCCGNPNEDGSCCNCPIPEPIQSQCYRCEATGYIRIDNPRNSTTTKANPQAENQ